MVRTPKIDKNGVKKGAWSEEEDNKLRSYIKRYGFWNWRELPKYAGLSRCGKSCRLRWMNYLSPNVKRGNYSKEEEDLIINLHARLGNKWSSIARKLPGRTDNEIKNHWHTHLRKRSQQNRTSSGGEDRSTESLESEETHKDQSIGNSQLNANQEREISPSSSEMSYSSPNYTLLSGTSWVAEDSITSSESFADPLENFWTQPFLVENDTFTNTFLAPLEEPWSSISTFSYYW